MRKLQFDAATIFNSTEGLFAVVVARDVPRQGGSEIFSEAVAWELSWSEACKRVAGILTGIGKPGISHWGEVVDARIYAEMLELPVLAPATPPAISLADYIKAALPVTELCHGVPRPWSAETLGAYQRENARLQRELIERLQAELSTVHTELIETRLRVHTSNAKMKADAKAIPREMAAKAMEPYGSGEIPADVRGIVNILCRVADDINQLPA